MNAQTPPPAQDSLPIRPCSTSLSQFPSSLPPLLSHHQPPPPPLQPTFVSISSPFSSPSKEALLTMFLSFSRRLRPSSLTLPRLPASSSPLLPSSFSTMVNTQARNKILQKNDNDVVIVSAVRTAITRVSLVHHSRRKEGGGEKGGRSQPGTSLS